MNTDIGPYLGCAGWSIASQYKATFATEGPHLQRYAQVLPAVEINSSFYRPHRPQTYAKWADSVPQAFRFSVKVPKLITHEQRLINCGAALDSFLHECAELGRTLGCLLVQLPPSLSYQPADVERFFIELRRRFEGAIVIEPRHRSWAAAQSMLIDLQIAQVAADPARIGTDAQPSGWPGLQYWRLHGSPSIYHSSYCDETLQRLAQELRRASALGIPAWCIFDNTASGEALGNVLTLQQLLSES